MLTTFFFMTHLSILSASQKPLIQLPRFSLEENHLPSRVSLILNPDFTVGIFKWHGYVA